MTDNDDSTAKEAQHYVTAQELVNKIECSCEKITQHLQTLDKCCGPTFPELYQHANMLRCLCALHVNDFDAACELAKTIKSPSTATELSEILDIASSFIFKRGTDPQSATYQRLDQWAYHLFRCAGDENQYFVIHYGQLPLLAQELEALRQQVNTINQLFSQASAQTDAKFFSPTQDSEKKTLLEGYQQRINALILQDSDTPIFLLSSGGKILQTLIECQKDLLALKEDKINSILPAMEEAINSMKELIAQVQSSARCLPLIGPYLNNE
jgi:hypothetical protein